MRHEGSALRDLLVGSVLSVNIIILKSGVPRLADLSDADYKDNLTAVGTLQVIQWAHPPPLFTALSSLET